MADCVCLAGCPFFNDKMTDKNGLAAMYKRMYCQGDYTKCARFKVNEALGRENVPLDLYPNMHDRAENLISSKTF